MRIAGQLVVGKKVDVLADVDGILIRGRDGVVDRGGELLDVQNEVGVLKVRHLAWGELDAVRIGARRSEIGDRHIIATDFLDEEGKRVERRRYGDRRIVDAGGASGAAAGVCIGGACA